MIRKSSISLLTIIALVSLASIVSYAQSQPLLTRHVREVSLNGLAPAVGRLPGIQSMRLVLVLPLRNQAALDNLLHDLYDPSSTSYRQFLTVEEFTAMFGPTQEDYDAVIRFAEANGLTVVGTSRNRMNVDVTGSVANIEKAFHLTMGSTGIPRKTAPSMLRTGNPRQTLAVQLWHISGLDNYSIPRPAIVHRELTARSNATTGSGPSASFLGSDMRAAYYGGTSHRHRPVARVARVLRHRFGRSDHILQERRSNQQCPRHSQVHGRNQHELRLSTGVTTPNRPWT